MSPLVHPFSPPCSSSQVSSPSKASSHSSQAILDQCTASLNPWRRLWQVLIEKKVIDHEGNWIKGEFRLPELGQPQKERLATILHTHYNLKHYTQSGHELIRRITPWELFSSLGYERMTLIGGGLLWVLGKEFLKELLISLDIPEELINEALFGDLEQMPQDFDFRFYAAPSSNPKHLTYPLFNRLSSIFKRNVNNLVKEHPRKWCSKPGDRNKYALVTLELWDSSVKANPKKACDFDCIFVSALERFYLFKSDAASLEISFQGSCWISSCLVHPGEAFIHYLARQMDPVDHSTVNDTGCAKALLNTTLCWSGPATKLLSSEQDNEAFRSELKKIAARHARGPKEGMVALAVNASSLVAAPVGVSILQGITPTEIPENTFLGKIFHASGQNLGVIYTLLYLHVFCNGEHLEICENPNFLELYSKSTSFSFLLPKTADFVLPPLTYSDSWKTIAPLIDEWLPAASFDSIPLPDDCQTDIDTIQKLQYPAAKKLAFCLLLKNYNEAPAPAMLWSILTLLIEERSSFPEDTLWMTDNLFAILRQSPSYSVIDFLIENESKLRSQFLCKDTDVIDTWSLLLDSGDAHIVPIALERLLDNKPRGTETAWSWMQEADSSFLPLFLKHHARFGRKRSELMTLFVKTLVQMGDNPPHIERKLLEIFFLNKKSPMKGLDKKNKKSLLKKIKGLPSTPLKQVLFEVLKIEVTCSDSTQQKRLDDLLASTSTAGLRKPLNAYKLCLDIASDNNFQQKMKEAFQQLATKFAKYPDFMLELLTAETTLALAKNDPQMWLKEVSELPLTINKDNEAKCASLCLNLATTLSANEKVDPLFLLCCESLESLIKQLNDPRKPHLLNHQYLSKHLGTVALLLHAEENKVPFRQILSTCQIAGLRPVANNFPAAWFLENPRGSSLEDIKQAVKMYCFVTGKSSDSPLPEKALEQLIDAYFDAEDYTMVSEMAKKLSADSPILLKTVQGLSSKNRWKEHKTLLGKVKANKETLPKLANEWLLQGQKGWAALAAADFFEDEAEQLGKMAAEDLTPMLCSLIKKLRCSGEPTHHKKALDLLEKFDFPHHDPIWSQTIQKMAESQDKEAVSRVWAILQKQSVCSPYTWRLALQSYLDCGFFDRGLLTFLDEGNLEKSSFYPKAEKQNGKKKKKNTNKAKESIRRLLLENAKACHFNKALSQEHLHKTFHIISQCGLQPAEALKEVQELLESLPLSLLDYIAAVETINSLGLCSQELNESDINQFSFSIAYMLAVALSSLASTKDNGISSIKGASAILHCFIEHSHLLFPKYTALYKAAIELLAEVGRWRSIDGSYLCPSYFALFEKIIFQIGLCADSPSNEILEIIRKKGALILSPLIQPLKPPAEAKDTLLYSAPKIFEQYLDCPENTDLNERLNLFYNYHRSLASCVKGHFLIPVDENAKLLIEQNAIRHLFENVAEKDLDSTIKVYSKYAELYAWPRRAKVIFPIIEALLNKPDPSRLSHGYSKFLENKKSLSFFPKNATGILKLFGERLLDYQNNGLLGKNWASYWIALATFLLKICKKIGPMEPRFSELWNPHLGDLCYQYLMLTESLHAVIRDKEEIVTNIGEVAVDLFTAAFQLKLWENVSEEKKSALDRWFSRCTETASTSQTTSQLIAPSKTGKTSFQLIEEENNNSRKSNQSDPRETLTWEEFSKLANEDLDNLFSELELDEL